MKFIVIAGEEAGPVSNKLGGIWEVIDAEAATLAKLAASGEIENAEIFVVGPYFKEGADWSLKKRTTKLEFEPQVKWKHKLDMSENPLLKFQYYENKGIKYVLFDTDYEDTISNEIKKEAYELVGLDSLSYEKTYYGREYTHYLNLSYAVSEFVKILAKQGSVSLHCHEYSIFYAGARLKKLGIPVRSTATFHATKIGRMYGAEVIEKIASNNAAWHPNVQLGLAELEKLAKYFDVITFVGDATRSEAKLFYKIDGIVIRNGIVLNGSGINWEKKEICKKKLQDFLAAQISKIYGTKINPADILPIYTISRLEIENKGYIDLLDALVIYDRVLQNHIKSGEVEENIKIVCFLITAQTQKHKLPEGFPVVLPNEILTGEELKLKRIIYKKELQMEKIIEKRRAAAALFYPQWIGKKDGVLNMSVDEIAAGCIAGIFPSRYDPFLLTGLEAAREGTPVIVSRVCGFSDAVYEYIEEKGFAGGVEIIDNIALPYLEVIADYSTALFTVTEAYLKDRSKYKMMCNEAFRLAEEMSWEEPVRKYYELLGGKNEKSLSRRRRSW